MNIFNIVLYIVFSVAFMFFAKLIWYLFKLVVFKFLIDNCVDLVILANDDGSLVGAINNIKSEFPFTQN